MKLIPVKEHSELFREAASGAIINKDTSTYKQYLARKQKIQEKDKRLNRLEQEVENLKELCEKLCQQLKEKK